MRGGKVGGVSNSLVLVLDNRVERKRKGKLFPLDDKMN